MGIFDIFTGSSAKKAAAENKANLAALKTEGMGYLDSGLNNSLASLTSAGNIYGGLASKYGAGTDLYLDALGVNGAEGSQRASDAYTTSPGYQFQVDQALQALDRNAASRGLLASGNTTNDTLSTVTGLASQDYNNWLNNLSGLISPEVSGTTGQANSEASKAQVYTNDANSRVNLAQGVTTGINSQNTQAANAAMQGSGNLWNFGLNLAKLGTGLLGGF